MYYFAYGSNINRDQMLDRCLDSKPMFLAILPNYKMVFVHASRKWRGGVASIKRFRGERVIGAIYEISEQNLRQLDIYEGYPNACDRVKIRVFDKDGKSVEAVTYIKAVQSEEAPPSQEYLAIIQQGYKDWGIT